VSDRIDAKAWDDIRKFSRAMRDAGLGRVEVVVDSHDLAGLFDELDDMKKKLEARGNKAAKTKEN